MDLTFRARLTIGYLITVSCLLALTAVGLLYALNRIAQKKFDTALWMLGAAEAEGITANLHERGVMRPDDQTVINSRYREILGYENGRIEKYVTVVDDLHHVADISGNLSAPLPIDDELLAQSFDGEAVYKTTELDGIGSLRIVYMPVRGPLIAHPFIVMVGLPESFVGSEMRSFRSMIVFAVVTLVLLMGASAMLLADRAIKPLEEITAAAESITAENLQAQLPEPLARDQIGRLVKVFNQMLARLNNAFEAQRRFTSWAAHELRTPLTILKGEAQVALRRRRVVADYEALLKSSLEEIDKLESIIDDLLLLARYEAGEADIPRQPIRLDEIVHTVATDLRILATKKKIELHVDAQELFIDGEPKAIERLVCKLMENGLHYTLRGGYVSVRLLKADDRVTLIVEDNGIGIKTEDMQHLFDRFFRSSAAREMRPEGSGVGLPMSAAIARLHKATITVESKPGKGTRFIVSFPPKKTV